MSVLTATQLLDAGVPKSSPDYLAFVERFGDQVAVNDSVVTEYATTFRWDHLAACLFSEEDHDIYVEAIYEPLQAYGVALHAARLAFSQSSLFHGASACETTRKKMRFQRARLQESKARAFMTIYAKSREAVS